MQLLFVLDGRIKWKLGCFKEKRVQDLFGIRTNVEMLKRMIVNRMKDIKNALKWLLAFSFYSGSSERNLTFL